MVYEEESEGESEDTLEELHPTPPKSTKGNINHKVSQVIFSTLFYLEYSMKGLHA